MDDLLCSSYDPSSQGGTEAAGAAGAATEQNEVEIKGRQPEDFTVQRKALHAFLEIFTLVIVGVVAVYWTYRHNHGYWLLYFGQHGPFAESCLIALLGTITLWMRAALFPARECLPPSPNDAIAHHPQKMTNAWQFVDLVLMKSRWKDKYSVSVASKHLQYLADSVPPDSPMNEEKQRQRITNRINIVILSLFSIATLLMYSEKLTAPFLSVINREWITLALLLCSGFLYTVNKRMQVVTQVPSNTTDRENEVAMQIAKGEFQSKTRGSWEHWSFYLLIAMPSVAVWIGKTVIHYRWSVPFAYYIGWTLPCVILTAWCWEVMWSVVGSYRPSQIKKLSGIVNLYWLYQALGEDTMRLIWSLGAFCFFLVGFFGDFYVDITKFLYFIAVALIVSIALLPWIWAHAWAEAIIRAPLNEREKELAGCYESKDKFPEDWKATQLKMNDLLTEITSLKSLLAKFELMQWMKDRQTDLLPVTLINLVGPYITGPILNLIHNLTK